MVRQKPRRRSNCTYLGESRPLWRLFSANIHEAYYAVMQAVSPLNWREEQGFPIVSA
jgi:hypothetical protein